MAKLPDEVAPPLLASIPDALKSKPQWVCWKGDKLPIDPKSGLAAKSNDPATWARYELAVEAFRNEGYAGIGFVFQNGDGLVGIDLDECRDADSGRLTPWAEKIVRELESYAEVSPSGRGVHIIVQAPPPCQTGTKHGQLEVYSTGRYFTVTGNQVPGAPTTISDRSDRLPGWFRENITRPRADDGIKKQACKCERFQRLWAGDISDFHSSSEAHQSFCCILAKHTRDADLIDRLMRRSKLYGVNAEKWDRADYRERTIRKAFEAGPIRGAPQDAEEWTEPIPFGVYDLPEFPLEAIPAGLGDLRKFCHAGAETFQVLPDTVAMLALAVAGAALAKRMEVCVKPDWREPLNVFCVVTMPSGERKSAVFRAVAAPLLEYEQEQNERLAPLIDQNRNERAILEIALKQARDAAAKAKKADDRLTARGQVDDLAEQLHTMETLVPLQLVADDSTPEALSRLLSEQGGRVALLSPEGDVFDLMAGRYSDGVSRLGVYLKAHAGDDIRVNRVGREYEYIRYPAISMGLAVQPSVLQGMLEREQLRGRGLLARILYSLPTSLVGHRALDPEPIPDSATVAYRELIRAALQLEPALNANGDLCPLKIELGDQAQSEFRRFRECIEIELRESGELAGLRDWGSKLPGAVCRIAGVFHGLMNSANPAGQPINAETMLGAIEIGGYLIEHAKAAFGLMGSDPAVAVARQIQNWIVENGLSEFTKRDAHRATRVARASELDAPLTLLFEHGYIRERPTDRRGPGRSPSMTYEVSPLWVGQLGQNGQNSA